MPEKKHDPRSEAAQREAIKKLKGGACVVPHWSNTELNLKPFEIAITKDTDVDEPVEVYAIFDLRDCFRKRSPLTGYMKSQRKAVQPKRRR